MKCLAMGLLAEFHGEDDVRFLLRLLAIRSYERAAAVIERYDPLDRFPQKGCVPSLKCCPRPIARRTRSFGCCRRGAL